MIIKLKLWLLRFLVQDLKQQFFNGDLDYAGILSKKDLLDFTKKVTRKTSWVKEVYKHVVKKGQIKYTLLIVDTLDGQYKVNIGRHEETQPRYFTLTKTAA